MPKHGGIVLGLSALMFSQVLPAQDASPQNSAATIRTSVQEVVLDMVIRDSRGRPVKNLQPGDVGIYEDGARQEIVSFRMVNGRDMERQSSGKGKKEQAPATAASNPLQAVNLVCIVFHNLDPYNKKNAMDAAREFLSSALPAGAWVGIFSLDNHLNVLHPFTRSHNELMQAAANAFTGPAVDFMSAASAVLNATPSIITMEETVNGTPGKGGTVSSAGPVRTGGDLNPRAINGADVSNSAASNAQRGDLASQRREFGAIKGMQAMDQLEDLIQQFGTLPGRKTVLFLSPGLTTTGDADLFKSILDKANRAGITFYAVDINGLTENSIGLASSAQLSHTAALSAEQGTKSGSAADSMERMRQSDYALDAVRTTNTQASLRALSEGTGGFLTGGTNDYGKSFQHIIEDIDTHYEAIYHPSSKKYDGRLRTIEVKLARPELHVESRTGYFAMPYLGDSSELAPYEMTGLAALSLHSLPHAFDFRSAALQFRPGAGDVQRTLVFEVPVHNLDATAQPEVKGHRVHASILALVKDANGQVVDKFSQDSPYEIPDANFAAAENSTFQFTHSFNLPAGRYTVDTAILDREANRAATGSLTFDNPEPKGIGLSSIVLVQHLENGEGQADPANPFQFSVGTAKKRQITPELSSSVNANAHPYVYFVVYPDKSNTEKPRLHVELLLNGQVLAQQDADLPNPDASGAIPMVIGAAAKQGKCELKLTAIQGSESMQQSLAYAVQ